LAGLSPKERELVKSVWGKYKQYSASALRERTHKERPWRETRGNLAPHEKCSLEIPQELLREYFGSKLASRLPKGFSLEQLVRAEEEIDRGQFVTHRELESRLARKRNAV
jgi:hypothetical protein